jgi:hypothetical protein
MTAPCPRCGATVTFAKRPAIGTCTHCQTFLVFAGGSTLPARSFSRTLADGVFALVCNLCGGPLPSIDPTSKVLSSGGAIPKHVVCEYCDHDADLPPTAMAVLRLLVTKPSVAPPAVASMGRAWLGIGSVGLTVIVVAFARGSDHSTLEADVGRDDLPWKSQDVDINPRSGGFPSLSIHDRDAVGSAHQCMKVSFVDVGRNITRSDWVTMTDGSGKFLFGVAWLPAGTYRVELLAFEGATLPPKSVHVDLDTLRSAPLGWLIIAANVLIWFFVFDLRWTKGSFTRSPRKSRVVRVLALVSMVVLGIEIVHPLENGPGEELPSKKAGKAPAWCHE